MSLLVVALDLREGRFVVIIPLVKVFRLELLVKFR